MQKGFVMRRSGLVFAAMVAVAAFGATMLCAQAVNNASTEMHMTNDLSSNSSLIAAIRNPVKAAPYAAQKMTHSEWRLGDGTVITHDADSKIARDGEGRVREEVENIHAGSIGGKQLNRDTTSVTIADPVDHSVIVMTGTLKIAMRMGLPTMPAGPGHPGGITPLAPVRLGTAGEPGRSSPVRPLQEVNLPPGSKVPANPDDVHTEDLGKQSLSGALVTGKRTTTVIAMGKIGNDRPITVVHEEWYSPELQLVVKSMDSDPRSGVRTMELQGLTLGEPDAALFRVPEGYKVRDAADMMKSLETMGHLAGASSTPVQP